MILRSMKLQEPPQTSDLDQKIKHVMARHPSVGLAILFGSMAKDRARNDSDLDIAVASSSPLTAQTHIAIIEDLALAVGRPVDLIDLDRTHNPLLQQILTKGRRVLCRIGRVTPNFFCVWSMKKRTSCPTTAAFCRTDDRHGSGPNRRPCISRSRVGSAHEFER